MRIRLLKDGAVFTGKDIPHKLLKYGTTSKKGFFIPKLPFLYILDKGLLNKIDYNKPVLYFNYVLEKFRKYDSKVFSKYLIYRDLMDRGYVVTEGYGRGIDLLVFDKGDFPDKTPSIRVIGVEEGEYVSIETIIDELRFSSLNKKKLVLAVIERRGEVIYYSIGGFGKYE